MERGLVPLSEVPEDFISFRWWSIITPYTMTKKLHLWRNLSVVCEFGTQKYNDAAIVFDGYTNIKDGSHMKRTGNCVDTFPVIWFCNAANMTS